VDSKEEKQVEEKIAENKAKTTKSITITIINSPQ